MLGERLILSNLTYKHEIMEGVSGNRGPAVRSDCFISIRPGGQDGLKIELAGKSKTLYGRQIINFVTEILQFFELYDADVFIEDNGALPYVIAARTEAALKRFIDSTKQFLLPEITKNRRETSRNWLRRSRLYLPGDHPKLMINAGLYQSDGIILDLEDSVAHDKKHDARFLVRNALRNNDFQAAELMVRINQLPLGFKDLEYIVSQPVNVILIPKCEYAAQVEAVDLKIKELKGERTEPIWLMPIIESALGVIHSYEIATSSPNVVALAIGLEDYTADIGAERTTDGTESLFARSMLVNSARAAGVQPIDSVFSDFENLQALRSVAKYSKSMGFVGMGCIHPAQISIINESYQPSKTEIEKAKRIVLAFDEAHERGLGVISLGSKMIDAPIVKRALNTIEMAIKCQLVEPNWKEEDGQ